MSKILITGAAGFIGFHLVGRFIKEGNDELVGLDNINDYYGIELKYSRLLESGINNNDIEYNKHVKSFKSDNYRFIKLDISDKKNLFKLFEREKFDYIISLAAQAGTRYSIENPDLYIKNNLIGFYNILESCRRHPVKHLLYASSSSVYGNSNKIPFSENDKTDNPVSLYAATKKSNELMAYTYSHLFNMYITGLRFFTVYGPWGRPDMAYYKFADKILNDEEIEIYNFGKMKRDFTYIDDIIEGINRIIYKKPDEYESTESINEARHKVLNVGNNHPENLEYLIELIEKYLGKKAKKKYLQMQPGDVMDTYADVSSIKREVDFSPSTSLSTGLLNFTLWLKEYKNNKKLL